MVAAPPASADNSEGEEQFPSEVLLKAPRYTNGECGGLALADDDGDSSFLLVQQPEHGERSPHEFSGLPLGTSSGSAPGTSTGGGSSRTPMPASQSSSKRLPEVTMRGTVLGLRQYSKRGDGGAWSASLVSRYHNISVVRKMVNTGSAAWCAATAAHDGRVSTEVVRARGARAGEGTVAVSFARSPPKRDER